MSDLKTILGRIQFTDDAQVQRQLVDQVLRVKTRLALIRRKILILSGKGGVGKSTVTAQLGLALARQGQRVGILDADLNGSSIPRMLGLQNHRIEYSASGAGPVQGPLGLRVASMAFLADPATPLRWKGPMDLSTVWLGSVEAGVLRELLGDVAWGELDYLLFDMPPGAAADKPPILANLIPDMDGAIVVTTPSLVAIDVVRKSILYARDLGIPILGLVENMGSGSAAAEALAAEMDIPILARIPMDTELERSSSSGFLLDREHPVSKAFEALAYKVKGDHEGLFDAC